MTAARIFVGKAPWAGGTSKAMTGAGQRHQSATLTATVAPGAKKVLAYVQGKDAAGNWGPAQAVWIPPLADPHDRRHCGRLSDEQTAAPYQRQQPRKGTRETRDVLA